MTISSDEIETPPRAWGRHTIKRFDGNYCRNTPTGVGTTRVALIAEILMEKHPHGRGEDTCLYPVQSYQPETPPRAWGRLSGIKKPAVKLVLVIGKAEILGEECF